MEKNSKGSNNATPKSIKRGGAISVNNLYTEVAREMYSIFLWLKGSRLVKAFRKTNYDEPCTEELCLFHCFFFSFMVYTKPKIIPVNHYLADINIFSFYKSWLKISLYIIIAQQWMFV